MKDWMLALPIALLTLTTTVQAEISSDPKALSDQLFRSGLAFCNAASKKSRTDSISAREDFNDYQSHLERARAIFPPILEENSFAQREAKRCELVEDNIARAEAMPLIEEGFSFCSAAKRELRGATGVGKVESNLHMYQSLRDQALETTPTILRVGSVAVQIRVCDSLEEKISLAKNQFQRNKRDTELVVASYNKAADTCKLGTSLLKGATDNVEKLKAAEQVLRQLARYQNQADLQSTRLINSASVGADSKQQIGALKADVSRCHSLASVKINQAYSRIQQQAEVLAKQKAAEAVERLPQQQLSAQVNQLPQRAIVAAQIEEVDPTITTSDGVLRGGEVAQIGANEL